MGPTYPLVAKSRDGESRQFPQAAILGALLLLLSCLHNSSNEGHQFQQQDTVRPQGQIQGLSEQRETWLYLLLTV